MEQRRVEISQLRPMLTDNVSLNSLLRRLAE